MRYEIGIVDDHLLFASSLAMMLESFSGFSVTLDVNSGTDMQQQLARMPDKPDIMLVDVNMPGMSGVDCARWLTQQYPAIKIAALTMNDTDVAVLDMIHAGCCSYLLKNTHPNELERALIEIAEKGYYNSNSDINFKKLMRTAGNYAGITDVERQFLKHACSDMKYDHIAALMKVSGRTVESYRASVFAKLNVQSRPGMIVEALKRGLVEL